MFPTSVGPLYLPVRAHLQPRRGPRLPAKTGLASTFPQLHQHIPLRFAPARGYPESTPVFREGRGLRLVRLADVQNLKYHSALFRQLSGHIPPCIPCLRTSLQPVHSATGLRLSDLPEQALLPKTRVSRPFLRCSQHARTAKPPDGTAMHVQVWGKAAMDNDVDKTVLYHGSVPILHDLQYHVSAQDGIILLKRSLFRT